MVYSDVHNNQGGFRPKEKAGNSSRVSHVGGRDPGIGAVTCFSQDVDEHEPGSGLRDLGILLSIVAVKPKCLPLDIFFLILILQMMNLVFEGGK